MQEELLDILDSKGNKTGEVQPKRVVHEKGLWHLAVHIWFVDSKQRVLLQKRSMKKDSHPGEWDISCAGHVSAGESSRSSALREIQEELGVNLSDESLKLIGSITQQSIQNNGTYLNNEFNDLYLVELDISENEIKMQESEVDEVKWVPLPELIQWVKSMRPGLVPHPKEYELLFSTLQKQF